MAKDYMDVADIVDAYKKAGNKVSDIKRHGEGHFSFERIDPENKKFLHTYKKNSSKVESQGMGNNDEDAEEGSKDTTSVVKRGRGRPRKNT